MKNSEIRKKIQALFLVLVIFLTSVQIPVHVLAEDAGSSGTINSYKQVFTEDWENGLTIGADAGDSDAKWYMEKQQDSFKGSFQVVDDPIEKKNNPDAESYNQVVTWTHQGTWLIPTDAYWPGEEDGAGWGQIETVSFRMYLENADADAHTRYMYGAQPGIMLLYADTTRNAGMSFYTKCSLYGLSPGFYALQEVWRGKWLGGISHFSSPEAPAEYVEQFAHDDWINVTISVDTSSASVKFTNKNGFVASANITQFPSDAAYLKYALGNRRSNNSNGNREMTNGVTYVDDIKVTFKRSRVDADTPQTDVNAYYAGNTFIDTNGTVDIIGAKLGEVVDRAQLIKLKDEKSADLSYAQYVNEDSYDKASLGNNITWEELKTGAVKDSLIEDWTIEQRSVQGIKMILPDGTISGEEMYATDGVYAVNLESKSGGESDIVVVNNPQVNDILCDDGDYATSNGFVKLVGSNLCVQSEPSKVSAILIDKEDGSRILVDSSHIEVQTEENHETGNNYYIMVHFDGLAPGDYQIMVHNGYGGDYGWSMPCDFHVETMAANMEWRAKGVFNVRDYGAKASGVDDTAAIMSAIVAAEKNGGGMVYFPANNDGTPAGYRITYPLIVGENISLVGDGDQVSSIYYDGYLDAEIHQYLITYERNFELSDLRITTGNIGFNFFLKRSTAKNKDAGKVYVKDCYLRMETYGSITESAHEVVLEGTDAKKIVEEKWRGKDSKMFSGSDVEEIYIELSPTYWQHNPIKTAATFPILACQSQYFYMKNMSEEFGSYDYSATKLAIVENCFILRVRPHTLMMDCYGGGSSTNNLEILVSDNSMRSSGALIEPLLGTYTDDQLEELLEEDLKGISNEAEKSKLIQNVKNYLTDHKGKVYRLLGFRNTASGELVVTKGQGAGQYRMVTNMIKYGSNVYCTIEEPFIVTPNRSSRVSYRAFDGQTMTIDTIINNYDALSGGFVGLYGNGINIVFDHVTMRKADSGVGLTAAYKGNIWYTTIKRNDVREVGRSGLDGIGAAGGGIRQIGGDQDGMQYIGIRYEDSSFQNNAIIDLAGNGCEIIYEDLEIVSEKSAFPEFRTDIITGLWLRNISQKTDEQSEYNEISPYQNLSTVRSGMKEYVLDTADSMRTWCDHVDADYKRVKGDLNNDGMVTLADVTILRNILGEQTTADSTALTYADIIEDSSVDAYDFLYLRAYIVKDEDAMDEIFELAVGRTDGTYAIDLCEVDYNYYPDEEED